MKMTSSKQTASDAGRLLGSDKGSKKEREFAAADLAQAKRKSKKKPKKS
jgi:hypothetical protein